MCMPKYDWLARGKSYIKLDRNIQGFLTTLCAAIGVVVREFIFRHLWLQATYLCDICGYTRAIYTPFVVHIFSTTTSQV